MFVQFKGNGILVPLFALLPFVVLELSKHALEEYCFGKKFAAGSDQLIGGISFLISGFLTNYKSDDFYIDKNGEKQYMNFDNKFMFMPMKIWAYIYWIFGVGIFLSAFADLLGL